MKIRGLGSRLVELIRPLLLAEPSNESTWMGGSNGIYPAEQATGRAPEYATLDGLFNDISAINSAKKSFLEHNEVFFDIARKGVLDSSSSK